MAEITVIGRGVFLPDDRTVWLGKCPDVEGTVLVLFQNEGEKTKLRLSLEALDALVALKNGGGIDCTQVYREDAKPFWRRVDPTEPERGGE